ncbi:MAG: hypothetical protein PHE58_04150 [Candidatus Omnitrophica bacterium]|nr:hypothetical protein [Candidatus Omnitrophota bacterium]
MIAIITIIFLSVSVLVTTFLGFSPNFHGLIEEDFKRRVTMNYTMYGLTYGEVAFRAGTLKVNPKQDVSKPLPIGYTKMKNNVELDQINGTVILSPNSRIRLNLNYEAVKPKK